MSDPRDRSAPPPPPTATVRRPSALPERGSERGLDRFADRAPERPGRAERPAERAADRIAERVAERMAERKGERPAPEGRPAEPRAPESRHTEARQPEARQPPRSPEPRPLQPRPTQPAPPEGRAGQPVAEPRAPARGPEPRPAEPRPPQSRGEMAATPRARDLLRAELARTESARADRQEAPAPAPKPAPADEAPAAPEPAALPAGEVEDSPAASRGARGTQPRALSPIVPGATVTGNALVAVIAIMTFLAGLTIGAVASVRTMASGWSSEIAREVTIQIKPTDGLDIAATLQAATQAARAVPGIAAASPLDERETAALLEPWLGAGLDIAALPVPRLVVVTLAPDADGSTIAALKATLAAKVPSASLDDHRQWSERLSSTARAVVAMGLAVLALVSAATVLSVVFATRAAVAAGRSIVEVLHFVGARDGFIAAEFQHHFLAIGLKGGAIGGGAAMALFLALTYVPAWFGAGMAGLGVDTLIGGMSLDLRGYGGILGVVVLVALVVSATSRITVYRTLRSIS